MMRLEIKGTSEKLRRLCTNGMNCPIEIITEDGDVLLGGTYAQRAWLTGDKTQGFNVPMKNAITDEELQEIREWEGEIYVMEDTLYLVCDHPELNHIKFPLELLPIFKDAGIIIEDLR